MKRLNYRIRRGWHAVIGLALAVCILLTSAQWPGMKAFAALGESGILGISLGFSGESIPVRTPDELYAISKRVNGGEDFSHKMILIQEDIQLSNLQLWEPIGSQAHPFKGHFEGNKKVIGGLTSDPDRAMFAMLFGYVENASVRNVTLGVREADNLDNVANYLFLDAKTSTFENCKLVLEVYTPFQLFALNAPQPDILWYNSLSSSFTLTSVEQLLGLAKLVNEGTADFLGKTVTIGSDIDLSIVPSWQPVGTGAYPFKGTFTSSGGARLKNLTIRDVTVSAAGLFGYTEGAFITDISLVDADIFAAGNTGILVGHAKETEIRNCYTTGKVTGFSAVGGVIGYATSSTAFFVTASDSYSTADVVGTNMVGGFIGQLDEEATIEIAFATGHVSGILDVGGFAGMLTGGNAALSQSASSGNVSGAGKTGGIVGGTEGVFYAAQDSYTTSIVNAFSDSGAMLGYGAYTDTCYTSGQIYGPAGDPNINGGVGISGDSENGYANYDVVGKTVGRDNAGDLDTLTWFENDPTAAPSAAFVPATLVFAPGAPPSNPTSINLPIGGYYPQLVTFNSSSLQAFRIFSLISTDALLARMPTKVKCNGGFLQANNADVVLPTAGSRVSWTFEGGGKTHDIVDPTVPGGKNTITITSADKLEISYPSLREYTVTLVGSATGVEGLSIKKTLTIEDGAARPVLSTLPQALKDSASGPFPDTERISNLETATYIEFAEPMQFTPGTPAMGQYLTRVSDGVQTNLTYTLLTSTILKISWPANSLGYDNLFRLEIPAALGLKDGKGQSADLEYYFRSTVNKVAHITFEPNIANQESLNAAADEQIIAMQEEDPLYNSYMESVMIENESGITLTDADITFAVVETLFGTPECPAKGGDTVVDRTNFHKYRGIYIFTYQVDDPEENWKKSNAAVRTYKVVSEPKDYFFVDGVFGETYLDKYQPSIAIGGAEVGSILQKSGGAAAQQGILDYIQAQMQLRHKAVTQSSSGEIKLDIAYDFSGIPANLYKDGFIGSIVYGIDGAAPSKPFYLQVESALSRTQIVTDRDRIVIGQDDKNGPVTLDAFYPRIVRTNGPAGENFPAKWSLEGTVNMDSTYDAQKLTIYARDIFGIPGLELKKDVFVTVRPGKVEPFFRKLTQDIYDEYFWERVEVNLRKSDPNTTLKIDVDYKYAYAPASVFRALSERDNVTLEMTLKNGFVSSINSQGIHLEKMNLDGVYNIYVENIESLDVNRDAGNQPVQQFYADGYYRIPGAYTISVPLNEGLKDVESLNLYAFDQETKRYYYITQISNEELQGGAFKLETSQLDGEYVLAEHMEDIWETEDNHNPNTGGW